MSEHFEKKAEELEKAAMWSLELAGRVARPARFPTLDLADVLVAVEKHRAIIIEMMRDYTHLERMKRLGSLMHREGHDPHRTQELGSERQCVEESLLQGTGELGVGDLLDHHPIGEIVDGLAYVKYRGHTLVIDLQGNGVAVRKGGA